MIKDRRNETGNGATRDRDDADVFAAGQFPGRGLLRFEAAPSKRGAPHRKATPPRGPAPHSSSCAPFQPRRHPASEQRGTQAALRLFRNCAPSCPWDGSTRRTRALDARSTAGTGRSAAPTWRACVRFKNARSMCVMRSGGTAPRRQGERRSSMGPTRPSPSRETDPSLVRPSGVPWSRAHRRRVGVPRRIRAAFREAESSARRLTHTATGSGAAAARAARLSVSGGAHACGVGGGGARWDGAA